MCKLLNISRSSLYYAKNKPAKKYNAEEEKLTQHIKEIFKNSRNNYGFRKIKVELIIIQGITFFNCFMYI